MKELFNWIELVCAFILGMSIVGVRCKADEVDHTPWISTTLHSYHVIREEGHCESNFGVGFEVPVSQDVRIVGGGYHNSICGHSDYVGAAWFPLKAGHWKAGLAGIAVSGYNVPSMPIVPAAVPLVAYERKHWGFNFLTIGTVSAIQLKGRF